MVLLLERPGLSSSSDSYNCFITAWGCVAQSIMRSYVLLIMKEQMLSIHYPLTPFHILCDVVYPPSLWSTSPFSFLESPSPSLPHNFLLFSSHAYTTANNSPLLLLMFLLLPTLPILLYSKSSLFSLVLSSTSIFSSLPSIFFTMLLFRGTVSTTIQYCWSHNCFVDATFQPNWNVPVTHQTCHLFPIFLSCLYAFLHFITLSITHYCGSKVLKIFYLWNTCPCIFTCPLTLLQPSLLMHMYSIFALLTFSPLLSSASLYFF